jgi:hypothetical protein
MNNTFSPLITPFRSTLLSTLRNPKKPLRALVMGTLVASAMLIGTPASAERTGRVAIEWVRVDAANNIVRVKPKQGILKKASCQTEVYMMFELSNANAKMFLATLYTASATKGAKVRLYGDNSCNGGAEIINSITLFPNG